MSRRLPRRLLEFGLVEMRPIESLTPDAANPRRNDQARMGLLRLSIAKLGFLMPVFVERESGLLLSGHQRLTIAQELQHVTMPVMTVDVQEKDIKGINILFNRATNDFNAFDTGKEAQGKLSIQDVIDSASELPDADSANPLAMRCRMEGIRELALSLTADYDKKAVTLASQILRMGIRIPAVVTISNVIVNGRYRILAAIENKELTWPIVRIPDRMATVAQNFLNYLSMDFHVDHEFKNLLRYSAYRRPANNRGALPKAYRFWANGNRVVADRDSYSSEFWRQFRNVHGQVVLDFGAGLGKVAPLLRSKGITALDFEPYRIDPDGETGTPSPTYSKEMARRFLTEVSDPSLGITSIFLASVLNSVPFPEDRMCVLAVVHALCRKDTIVYGTFRDISDYNYEYGGARRANYFVWDAEPGVRIGDVMRSPKVQKFESRDSARAMFERLWNGIEFWVGNNIGYFALSNPKGINTRVLSRALGLEFDLPYNDSSTMGLVNEAKACFTKRLGMEIV